jgi:uncharacterized protein YcgI (DUF1989 family)
MYDHFYKNGVHHPNCLENINRLLEEWGLPVRSEITPFNIFMNTRIGKDGKITVAAPLSRPNDNIALRALMSMHVFLSACSVSESSCNGGRCTPARVLVTEDRVFSNNRKHGDG